MDIGEDGRHLSRLKTELPNPNTEQLDTLNSLEIANQMIEAEKTVPIAVEAVLPHIAFAVDEIVKRLKDGGRLFYAGAGTSGRIGVLDASECPPTFGTPPDLVQPIIAGGQGAMFEAVENAEDDERAGRAALEDRTLSDRDVVVGLAASGRTPFVIGALQYAHTVGSLTIGVSCNPNSEIGSVSDIAIDVDTGPEVLMGSTRLKAGTAQKLVLNIISTTTMVKLGKVYRNLMVDLRASNHKLQERSKNIIMLATQCSYENAATALQEAHGHVKSAIFMLERNVTFEQATVLLERADGHLRKALESQGS